MQETRIIWPDPVSHLSAVQPDAPIFYFARDRLARQYGRFASGFPGQVTFAVKSNPNPAVIAGLAQAGMTAFDVASTEEMALVRKFAPGAQLHYHNPVRSRPEITTAARLGIASWSVDRLGELEKLGQLPKGTEIAVRLKLPVKGAAYDFGAKFGATPDAAAALLARVAVMGFIPSITFHPGTQCTDPQAWAAYIRVAAEVARKAGVTLHRLNVGGGFPAERSGAPSILPRIFATIAQATASAFGPHRPALVCEPGRAMVSDAFSLGLRVKARCDNQLFLNDGIYGGLSEWRDLPSVGQVHAFAPDGTPRSGPATGFEVFGPTCDSVDRLDAPLPLPATIAEDDFLVFEGTGAYGLAMTTRFNGFGVQEIVPVSEASAGHAHSGG